MHQPIANTQRLAKRNSCGRIWRYLCCLLIQIACRTTFIAAEPPIFVTASSNSSLTIPLSSRATPSIVYVLVQSIHLLLFIVSLSLSFIPNIKLKGFDKKLINVSLSSLMFNRSFIPIFIESKDTLNTFQSIIISFIINGIL